MVLGIPGTTCLVSSRGGSLFVAFDALWTISRYDEKDDEHKGSLSILSLLIKAVTQRSCVFLGFIKAFRVRSRRKRKEGREGRRRRERKRLRRSGG